MISSSTDVNRFATGTERVGELRRTLVVCITNSEFTKVSLTPAKDAPIVSDGARVVFSCRQDIWFEFKSTERCHGLIEVEGDVVTKVIQRSWRIIVDSDVDVIRE